MIDKPTHESLCGEEHDAHSHDLHSDAQIEVVAQLCAAIGEPSRLRLLELLYDGPHCVSELASETGDGLSSVSQRLKILHQAGLVSRERDGKHVNYALADARIAAILGQLFAYADAS